jgi:ubiquinone/menaquinone biosynthesis C-methylase UbiE
MAEFERDVIPFYGVRDPRLFAIEREAMDRDGVLVSHLDSHLGSGRVLDVGAGNGHTARLLTSATRRVVPVEPAMAMIGGGNGLPFARGVAQELPFTSNTFNAAYATWAYFFPTVGYGEAGLAELDRVVRKGGVILICDNAGDDAFCAMFQRDISSDHDWWRRAGFGVEVLNTAFRFRSLEEAAELLDFYSSFNGRSAGAQVRTDIEFKIAVYSKVVGGG